MADIMAGIRLVEIVILAGVVLAFVVHPAMFILAGLRAVVLNALSPGRSQAVKVPRGSVALPSKA